MQSSADATIEDPAGSDPGGDDDATDQVDNRPSDGHADDRLEDHADDWSSRAYEEQHVHQVYDQIASHFSATRYKPWPIVSRFLLAQPAGSIGLDIGGGNGKYLAVNPSVFLVSSDRSAALTRIAARAAASRSAADAVVADALHLPHPPRAFDFATSVAVLHHLATRARRVAAVAAVLARLRPGAPALLVVWALEQRGSRRGWGAGDAQDVLVPWVTPAARATGESGIAGEGEGERGARSLGRYYHLYAAGELAEDVRAAGGAVREAGYERDNWWVVATARP